MASAKKRTWINSIAIVSAKKLEINPLVQLINAKNLFKMPNMHFKSQIYEI